MHAGTAQKRLQIERMMVPREGKRKLFLQGHDKCGPARLQGLAAVVTVRRNGQGMTVGETRAMRGRDGGRLLSGNRKFLLALGWVSDIDFLHLTDLCPMCVRFSQNQWSRLC